MDNKDVFNKAEFALLLEKAKGDRSINQYANETGVSAAHISRFLRQLIDAPPSPETLSKLASKAYNEVAYQDLMVAAGHLARQSESNIYENVEIKESPAEFEKDSIRKDSPMNIRREIESIEKRFMQIILADLYNKSFMWSPAKTDNRMRFPDMVLNIDDNGYKRWYLEFRVTLNDKNYMPFMHFQHVYGMLAMTELLSTDKFTIAVNNQRLYDSFCKRPPVSLRANLYVMLVDLDKGEIVKEEMLCKYE